MTKIFSILLIGVLIVSFGSALTRWAGDVPFAVISFYRLILCLPFLLLFYFFSKKNHDKQSRKFKFQYALAGFFLAAHMITWIASLQMTSIANSIFLESTHPFFALILSILVLKETPSWYIFSAFMVAIIGVFLIVFADWNLASAKTSGDLLAVCSALFLALYLLTARYNKDIVNLILYLIYVYGAAAAFCGLYILFNHLNFTGYALDSWIFMFLLAIGPNLIGHSLLNWASRKTEIYKVNLLLLLEPVVATIMGILFFMEYPAATFYAGAGLILFTLILIIQKENTKSV